MAYSVSLPNISIRTLRTELGWPSDLPFTRVEISTNLVSHGYYSSITRTTFFNCLAVLIKIHRKRELQFHEIKLVRCFQRYIQDGQIKKFIVEHNFLHIAKLLLRHCRSSICKNITINMIVELAKDEDTVLTDVINWIGEDLELVNFFLNHFRNRDYFINETFITHNLLRLFHLVAFTIVICPESPWITHLKNTNGFFGEFIIRILYSTSLPDNILKHVFCMIWKLLEVRFPNSFTTYSKPFLSDLFNMQQLIDGLAQVIHMIFLINNSDFSVTDWTSIGMWLDLMLRIRQPDLHLAQNLNFVLTFTPINSMAREYLKELEEANAEEELEEKFNILLRVLGYRVTEKCMMLVNTFKDDKNNSSLTQQFLCQINEFFYHFHSYINHLYTTYYYQPLDLSTIYTDEDAKARVELLISNVRTLIEALKSMLD